MTQDGARRSVSGSQEPLFKFVRDDGTLRPLHEVGVRPPFAEDLFGALDPDRSRAAVDLEHGLDLALEWTPALIIQALRGPIPRLVQVELRRRATKARKR